MSSLRRHARQLTRKVQRGDVSLEQAQAEISGQHAEALPYLPTHRRLAVAVLVTLLLLLTLGLSGCGQQRLARRCAELYPAEVIERRDTVVLAGELKTDTLRVLTTERDTVVLDTGRVRVVVIRQRDTLSIAAECRADTIRLPGVIETRVRTIEVQPPWWNRFWVGVSISCLVWGLIVFWASNRR